MGGWDGYCYTNKLFTLKEQGWVEKYPAMQSVRSSIAAVNTSDGEFIIVIGGFRGVWTTTVELFPVRSKKWHTTPSLSLPQSLSRPSATICGNQLNVIGDDGGYSCSLEDLLYTDEAAPHTVSWVALPPLPVTHSTAVTLCGQLVIIGGWRDRTPLNFIHQLSECTWTEIGSISCERGLCLVVNPSPDEIMVVGGVGEGYRTQDTVEEHTFCEEKSDKKNIHSVKNTSGCKWYALYMHPMYIII